MRQRGKEAVCVRIHGTSMIMMSERRTNCAASITSTSKAQNLGVEVLVFHGVCPNQLEHQDTVFKHIESYNDSAVIFIGVFLQYSFTWCWKTASPAKTEE